MQSNYMAMYAGMQELVWLRGVLKEVGLPCCEPTPFFLDSQSAEVVELVGGFYRILLFLLCRFSCHCYLHDFTS
jgi:hypothetical protein